MLHESPTYLIFGKKGFFAHLFFVKKAPGEEVMWWSNIPEERELSREEIKVSKPCKKSVMNFWNRIKVAIAGGNIICQSTNIFKSNIYDIGSLPNWSKNRVVLIGDAAHAMSSTPQIGSVRCSRR